jgi:hypothetical protein
LGDNIKVDITGIGFGNMNCVEDATDMVHSGLYKMRRFITHSGTNGLLPVARNHFP